MPSSTSPPERPTLSDVAAAAGVSLATASKVLNGRAEVAAATRARVNDAIARLDYTPSTGARPAARRSVHVVFEALVSGYPTEVLRGLLEVAASMAVEVHVDALDLHPERSRRPLTGQWFRHVNLEGHLGVVVVNADLTTPQIAAIRSGGTPVVLVDPISVPDLPALVSVSSTNFAGGVQATEHLLQLGHRRIGFIGGRRGSFPSRERFGGFRSALEHAGVPLVSALVSEGDEFDSASGIASGVAMLSTSEPPTAIFAASDSTAFGVIEAARRLQLRVPEDLSVVGFDDDPAVLWSAPPLTTVRQPIREMGAFALRILDERSRGGSLSSPHVQLATELVVRDSTTRRP